MNVDSKHSLENYNICSHAKLKKETAFKISNAGVGDLAQG